SSVSISLLLTARHSPHNRARFPYTTLFRSRQRETDRGEAVEIVRDALVRIVGRGLVELHPVIGLVAQPILQVALGHPAPPADLRSEDHTSELQSLAYLVCRLLLEKKNRLNA